MKIKLKKPSKDDPIFKSGFVLHPAKNYFQKKEREGKKLDFFEKIGDKKTTRDQMLRNLIKALIKNGWKIKN